jgi:hypothetical protein
MNGKMHYEHIKQKNNNFKKQIFKKHAKQKLSLQLFVMANFDHSLILFRVKFRVNVRVKLSVKVMVVFRNRVWVRVRFRLGLGLRLR